jgi:TetR/AcrR family transcriptional regulator, cholesterol catabolism regulator
MNNIEKRRFKRRQQLCRGAMKLFRKKGFSNTSMREIASASGISLGNLYNYINKKEDILFMVQEDILENLHGIVEKNTQGYDNPIDQLANMLKEVLKLTVQFRQDLLFIYTESKYLEKKYLREILKKEAEFISKFESLVKEGVDKGCFVCKNPALSAKLIVSTASMIVPLRSWNIFPQYSEEELFDEVIALTLKGLGVSSI